MTDLVARTQAYVAKMPPAVAGAHGHTATFKVAVALVHGFGLSEEGAMPIMEEYSSRCSPPWKREDLEHKLRSAAQHLKSSKPRGHLRASQRVASPEPTPPQRPKKKISLCLSAEKSQPEVSAPSSTTASECRTPQLSRDDEIEASRIAAELDRLHQDGAIASKAALDPDAVFYAKLLRDFGATYIGSRRSRQRSGS